MTLDQAAAALYQVPPAEFVAERDRLAVAAGDRATAQAIRALRKPTLAAWEVNLLVARQPELVDELVELGAALRSGAQDADASSLREANTTRRRLISALADHAGSLASEAGHPPSAAVRRDVEATLQAVLASPEAAAVVRAGRLTEPLSQAGLGEWSFAEGPARNVDVVPAGAHAVGPRTAASAPVPGTRSGADDRRRAQRELDRARTRVANAQRAAQDAEGAASEAAGLSRLLAEHVRDLEAQLEDLRARAAIARERWEQAEGARARSQADLEDAEARVRDAEERMSATERDGPPRTSPAVRATGADAGRPSGADDGAPT